MIEVDGRGLLHLPAPALVLEVDGRDFFGMGPDGAVSEAGGKLEGEALVEPRQVALEEPGLLGQVGMASLLVLIGDDAAGVAAGSVCDGPYFQVHEEIALAGIAVFGHLVVLDGVLVAVGADAPDMHGEDFAVLVEGHGDDALLPALRPEDLNDVAIMFDRAAVGGDGVGGVFEQNDGVGLGGVFGELLLRGGADPVGNAVRFGGEGRRNGEANEKDQG